MLIGARTAAWGGGKKKTPWLRLSSNNAEIRLLGFLGFQDGYSYNVDFVIDSQPPFSARQSIMWLQGDSNIIILETTGKVGLKTITVGEKHTASIFVDSTAGKLIYKIDGVQYSMVNIKNSLNVFAIGGYSNLLPFYDGRLISASITNGNETLMEWKPVNVSGVGYMENTTTHQRSTTNKNPTTYPVEYGESEDL